MCCLRHCFSGLCFSRYHYNFMANAAQGRGQTLCTRSPGSAAGGEHNDRIRIQGAFEAGLEIPRQADLAGGRQRRFELLQLLFQKVDIHRRLIQFQREGNHLHFNEPQRGVETRSHAIGRVEGGARQLGSCEGNYKIEFGRRLRLLDDCKGRLFMCMLSHSLVPDSQVSVQAIKSS